jgi:hypothetical protein
MCVFACVFYCKSLAKRADFVVETNDDRILQCCLQLADKRKFYFFS